MTQHSAELETLIYLFKEYLADQKRLREKGVTMEALYESIERTRREMTDMNGKQSAIRGVLDTLVADQIEVKMRLDRYGRRINQLEKHVHHGNDDYEPEENSQIIRLEEAKRAQEVAALKSRVATHEEDLKKERDRRDSDITFWQRQRGLWVVALISLVLTALCSGCVGLAIWKLTVASVGK